MFKRWIVFSFLCNYIVLCEIAHKYMIFMKNLYVGYLFVVQVGRVYVCLCWFVEEVSFLCDSHGCQLSTIHVNSHVCVLSISND